MIISTCGYGNSGASAVLDFLKGYGNASIARDFEFQLIHMPDGLLDLKYNLVKNRDRLAANASIMRFLRLSDSMFAVELKKNGCDYAAMAEEFINSLCPISWDGKSAFDPADVSGIKHNSVYGRISRNIYAIMRRINPGLASMQFKKRYFLTVSEEDFNSKAKIFLKKIFSSMGYDTSRNMLFDQLVSASDPFAGTEFIDEHKIIVVYRDPVDLFIRANTHQSTNAYFPCADVRQFAEYYKMIMKYSVRYDKALYMQYEDLIYNYYPATRKIMDFLGYKERPENEFKYFNPDISVKYTRADITYPGYDKEIEYVRQNLPEYLYSFPEKYLSAEEQKKNNAA